MAAPEYESLSSVLERANAWIAQGGLHILNVETLILPNLGESGGGLLNAPGEIYDSHSPRIRTAGEMRSHWYQCIRVWYREP